MKKYTMCPVHWIAAVLVFVGAFNWGLVGLFDFNLVSLLLGNWSTVERVVYVLVGLAGIMMLFLGACKKCGLGGSCCKDEDVGDGGAACCHDEKKV